MKKIIRTIYIALFPALMVLACNNPFHGPEKSGNRDNPEKAIITVSIKDIASRTVLPLVTLDDIAHCELWGGMKGGEETKLAAFSSGETSLSIETGTWNFTVNAFNNKGVEILQGKLLNQNIGAEGPNTLHFYLFPLNDDSGALEISFALPEGSNLSRIEVWIDREQKQIDTAAAINGDGTYTYINTAIESGDYFISFYFFNTKNELWILYSELAIVRRNCTSAKTIDLSDYALIIVPGTTLADKFDWLQANVKNGAEYLVVANNDENLAPQVLYYGGKKVSITLIGDTIERTINLSLPGTMFDIFDGVTLTLENNLALQKNGANVNVLVAAHEGAALIMNNGVSISENNGAGVGIWGGTFVMNGGTISENSDQFGGGVSVTLGGSFDMYGGTISGNTAIHCGGGVQVNSGAVFTMWGGSVCYNTAIEGGGGIDTYEGSIIIHGGTIFNNTADSGGGVNVGENGSFTMNDGSICDNTAEGNNGGGGGVGSYKGSITMNGGTISGNSAKYGGGINLSEAVFTMNSGTISGNTADSCGGVNIGERGSFIMWDGTISGNNGGTLGGGVASYKGTITMKGGTISANTAEQWGGGIFLGEDAIFTMNSGTISANTAEEGGGIDIAESGSFVMNGGDITGNEAKRGGGIASYRGTITMNGGTISGNTAELGGGMNLNEVIFTKSGGTITGYANDSNNGNAAMDDSGSVLNEGGHALFAAVYNTVTGDSYIQRKERTSGPNDNLSFNGRQDPPTWSGNWEIQFPFTITLPSSDEDKWHVVFKPPWLFDGSKIEEGDEYAFTYVFTSDVTMDYLIIHFADNSAAVGFWGDLSENIGLPVANAASGKVILRAFTSASDTSPDANTMSFFAGEGVTSQPTLTFTVFKLEKVVPLSYASPLTENIWVDVDYTVLNNEDWYSFLVSAGTEYYIWWNDYSDGDGTKTLDIKVSAQYENGNPIFDNATSGWDSPQLFTAASTGTVFVKVISFNEYEAGIYSIAYNTSGERPLLSVP